VEGDKKMGLRKLPLLYANHLYVLKTNFRIRRVNAIIRYSFLTTIRQLGTMLNINTFASLTGFGKFAKK